MRCKIYHRFGLRHEFGSRAHRQCRQRRGSRRRGLDLRARHAGRDARARPESGAAASADYLERRGNHHQTGARRGEKIVKGFSAGQVIGIGVDTTGSTPLPVDTNGQPLACSEKICKQSRRAGVVVERSHRRKMRPQYLAKCGGTYSSEWFWSKLLKCLRTAPEVFNAAHSWVELSRFCSRRADGHGASDKFIAGVCAAGHKAMWNAKWGGYPDAAFLAKLNPKLAQLRSRLTPRVHSIDRAVGGLTESWAKKTGLTRAFPSRSARLTRISARSVRAWRRARW
jgi:L-ribulokinase